MRERQLLLYCFVLGLPMVGNAADVNIVNWSGSAYRYGSELNQLPYEYVEASSDAGNSAGTYGAGTSHDNTWATFRSGYGSVGVQASAIFAETVLSPGAYAHFIGTALAQAKTRDKITVTSSDFAFGTIVPISILASLNYTYTTEPFPASGNPGAYPYATLYYDYAASISRMVNGVAAQVAPGYSVQKCFDIQPQGVTTNCSVPSFTGDPFLHQASDRLAYSQNVQVGDIIDLSMTLTVAVKGDLYNATLSPFTGSVVASIQAMNSLDAYFVSSNNSVGFTALSGHDYATPVPELSALQLVLVGLGSLSLGKFLRKLSGRNSQFERDAA